MHSLMVLVRSVGSVRSGVSLGSVRPLALVALVLLPSLGACAPVVRCVPDSQFLGCGK